MSIAPTWLRDVSKGELIQLLIPCTTIGIYRQQNRPCDQQSHEADHAEDFQESEKQEAVQGGVVEDIFIGSSPEWHEPIEPSIGQFL